MAIANGTALAVCDGSYMPQARQDLGSASWVIKCGQSKEHCCGVIQTSGEMDDVNAYQLELQGIHELLMVIEAICTIYEITSARIQLGCNNKKVVWLSSTYLPQLSSHMKHVDLVWAIKALVQSIPVTMDFQHINGHQDEKIPFHQLDRMAQLNMWMDEEVKCYLRYLISFPFMPLLHQTIQGGVELLGRWNESDDKPIGPHQVCMQSTEESCMNGFTNENVWIKKCLTLWIGRQMETPSPTFLPCSACG